MNYKKFLLEVIADIKNEKSKKNWRGSITSWTKC